jgi:hypothetical protein
VAIRARVKRDIKEMVLNARISTSANPELIIVTPTHAVKIQKLRSHALVMTDIRETGSVVRISMNARPVHIIVLTTENVKIAMDLIAVNVKRGTQGMGFPVPMSTNAKVDY